MVVAKDGQLEKTEPPRNSSGACRPAGKQLPDDVIPVPKTNFSGECMVNGFGFAVAL